MLEAQKMQERKFFQPFTEGHYTTKGDMHTFLSTAHRSLNAPVTPAQC